MFGKLMSISDDLMWRYYDLLSFRPLDEIAALKAAMGGGRNPRDIKMELAAELVARFHDGAEAARQAPRQAFIEQFSAQGSSRTTSPRWWPLSRATDGLGLAQALKQAAPGVAAASEAFRMIKPSARCGWISERVEDPQASRLSAGRDLPAAGRASRKILPPERDRSAPETVAKRSLRIASISVRMVAAG